MPTMHEHESQLRIALTRAVDEHGAPNSFVPHELCLEYHAPSSLIQGRIGAFWTAATPVYRNGHIVFTARYANRTWWIAQAAD